VDNLYTFVMRTKPRRNLTSRFATPVLLAGALSGSGVQAEPLSDGQVISLWPGMAPGSQSLKLQEVALERSLNPSQPDRIIKGISQPSLQTYLPEKPNGAALIVIPGGGYTCQAIDKEGHDIARFFVAQGVMVFLLKYRLPSEGHKDGAKVPLQDAQRAIRLLRANAVAWGLDPARIMVMGFSAGGHLASMLATQFSRTVYASVDTSDSLSARPDGLILLYPVISMEASVTHGGSRLALLGKHPTAKEIADYSNDRQVRKDSPPTLIVLADDDTSVPPENSIRYYRALQHMGIPAELHIYSQGKHGFGIRQTGQLPIANWPKVTLGWMAARGLLQTKLDKEK
jgi:acetyl esterase/lipase